MNQLDQYAVGDLVRCIDEPEIVGTIIRTRKRPRTVLGLQQITVRDGQGQEWNSWNANYEPVPVPKGCP